MTQKAKTFYEKAIDKLVTQTSMRKKHYAQIRHSRALMKNQYAEKIELDTLAKSAFMSRYHYISIFREVYGVTPKQHLKDIRIAKAKELLQLGRSVTQVCLDVGYDSPSTFSNVFKCSTGLSPKKYQTQHSRNFE